MIEMCNIFFTDVYLHSVSYLNVLTNVVFYAPKHGIYLYKEININIIGTVRIYIYI